MNDIVKYHNEFNKIALKGFKEKELNILFALLVLAKEKGTQEIIIPFSDLRKLSNDDGNNRKRFIDYITDVNSKLIQLFYKSEEKDSITMFTLFSKFKLNLKDEELSIKISDDFSYMLNDFVGKFTFFELVDFVKLKSSYSKHMFRLLKQWQTKKEKTFELTELRRLLCVPQTYTTTNFNDRVFKPIKYELTQILPNFKIEKIKKGRNIVAIHCKWGEKHPDIEIPEDKVLEISEELANAFEKASKNRYIKPFLTEKGKSELLEAFGEEALIRGLPFAYKTIKKEFKSLVYLTRVIETGAKEQKVVIKTVKKDNYDIEVEDIQNDNIRQTSFDELPKEKKKIEVTEEEFEVLYKKYLEDNNASDSPFVRKGFAMPYSIKKENAEEK